MRTRTGAVVLTACAVLGLLAAGCGGSDDQADIAKTTTTTVSSAVGIAAVDDVIDSILSGSKYARTVDAPTTNKTPAQLKTAAADFRTATKRLEHGVPGVPKAAIKSAVKSLESMDAGLHAAVRCFDDPSVSGANPCAPASAKVRARGTTVATALLALIPYGTRTNREVIALLNA